MDHQPFDAGAALAFLDNVAAHFGPSGFLSIDPAWDAAWIACVSRDPRHEMAAQAEILKLIVEMDRLSIAATPARATAATTLAPP